MGIFKEIKSFFKNITLLELMIILAMIGIIASIVLPKILGY